MKAGADRFILVVLLAMVAPANGCNDILGVKAPGSGGAGGQVTAPGGASGQTGGGSGGSLPPAGTGGSGGAGGAPAAQTDAGSHTDAGSAEAGSHSDAGPEGGSAQAGPCGAVFAMSDQTGNLIANGDFSQGDKDWHLTSGSLDGGLGFPKTSVVNGRYCATFDTNGNVAAEMTLGWPSDTSTAAVLTAGQTYRLSYQACATGTPDGFEVKVGGATSPYTLDYDVTTDLPSATFQPFTHTFTPRADSQAGLAFNFSVVAAVFQSPLPQVLICFADVTLTPSP